MPAHLWMIGIYKRMQDQYSVAPETGHASFSEWTQIAVTNIFLLTK